MTTENSSKRAASARSCSPSESGALAFELLDEDDDWQPDAELSATIAQRVAAIDAGTAKLLTLDQVDAFLAARRARLARTLTSARLRLRGLLRR
jgi:hypothetical protein